jgi:hypothetical protein
MANGDNWGDWQDWQDPIAAGGGLNPSSYGGGFAGGGGRMGGGTSGSWGDENPSQPGPGSPTLESRMSQDWSPSSDWNQPSPGRSQGSSFPVQGAGDSPSMPTPMGTPPMPARSQQFNFSGPSLPAPQFQRLQQLLANPSLITNDPAYKFLVEQGTQAMNRTAGAQKMALSGKAMLDMTRFGQGSAMQYLNQIIQQLIASGHLDVSRYGASRFGTGTGSSVGPDPGTQGEYAARDLIPVMQKLLQRGGGMPSSPQPNLPQPSSPSYPNPEGVPNEDIYRMLEQDMGE